MSPDTPSPGNTPSATWMERKAQAERLCAGDVASTVPAASVEAIRTFASDPKWEVRKVVAEALSNLPELIFRELGPLLSSDSNAFVSAAARRSSERRLPAANIAASAPGKIQQAVDRIASKYGNAAADDAVKLAHQFTESHLRSAVHDIKNILTSLSLDPEKFTKVSTSQKRKLTRCKQGTDYLRHLAEMMARYAAEPKLECASESLSEIIAEAHASAVEQIERGGRSVEGVEYVCSIPDGLMLRLSRFHISMVMTNLIKNGIEAHAVSATEMKLGRVDVKVDVVGDDVVVIVADSGRGIAPGDLAQLREFIPGASSKPKTGVNAGSGTGYGLPICRRYVESHGGRLKIDSTEGKGTVVTFLLPHKTENDE